MSILTRLNLLLYWIGLVMWFAALAAAGVSAMSVFGTLPDMPLTLEAFAAYPAEEHGRIAAGQVMQRVFRMVDAMQYVAAPIVVVTLALQLRAIRSRPWAHVVRAVCIVAAAGLLAWYAIGLAPSMQQLLETQWSAAKAGDVATAEAARSAFERLHVRADSVYRGQLVLLLVAIGGSALALASTRRRPMQEASGGCEA